MKQKFFVNNRKKLIEQLPDNSMLVALSGKEPLDSMDMPYSGFVANRNFFYLTGVDEQNCALLILKRPDKVEEMLIIPKRTEKDIIWLGPAISPKTAASYSGIETIIEDNDMEDALMGNLTLNMRKYNFRYERLYFDDFRIDADALKTPAQKLAEKIKDQYPSKKLQSFLPIIAFQRMIKRPEEIKELKNAIAITNEGFKNMLKIARSGMFEYEMDAMFRYTCAKNGYSRASFPMIAAGGERAAILHYPHNNKQVYPDEWILLDFGAMSWRAERKPSLECADISRMIPVSGKFTPFQKKVYNTVLSVHRKSVELMRPGIKIMEWRDKTDAIMLEECLAQNLFKLKKGETIKKYFPHGIGHSLGMDAHDFTDLYGTLRPNMVYTNEPGLYKIPDPDTGKLISCRLENDILITENDPINLSADIMIETDEIEEFMAKNKE